MDLDSVYKEYAVFVYRYLFSMCMEEDTAEELTQETFYQAVRSAHKYDGSCKISTWLCQIAKHLWYRELERRKKKGTKPVSEDMPAAGNSPEEEVCLKEKLIAVFQKVHELDADMKEVFLLRITGTFSFREIGEILGKNENWARVTFYRAKQKIWKGWKEYEM